MTTRCKVTCTTATTEPPYTATFAAVFDANPESENGKFFEATPSVNIHIGTTRQQFFTERKEYYLDFTEVPQ